VGPFPNVLVASDSSPRDMWAIVKLDPTSGLSVYTNFFALLPRSCGSLVLISGQVSEFL